jgi:hypothetical protein
MFSSLSFWIYCWIRLLSPDPRYKRLEEPSRISFKWQKRIRISNSFDFGPNLVDNWPLFSPFLSFRVFAEWIFEVSQKFKFKFFSNPRNIIAHPIFSWYCPFKDARHCWKSWFLSVHSQFFLRIKRMRRMVKSPSGEGDKTLNEINRIWRRKRRA